MKIIGQVKRIPIDGQGYTKSGRYFGSGPRIYSVDYVDSNDSETRTIIRAKDHNAARKIVSQAKHHRDIQSYWGREW